MCYRIEYVQMNSDLMKTGCVLWTNLSFGVASNRERLQRSSHQPLITGNTRISATNSRATCNAIVYI